MSEAIRSTVSSAVLADRLVPIIIDVSIEHPRSLMTCFALSKIDPASEPDQVKFQSEFFVFALFPFDLLLATRLGAGALTTRRMLSENVRLLLNKRLATLNLPSFDRPTWQELVQRRTGEYFDIMWNGPTPAKGVELFGFAACFAMLGRADFSISVGLALWYGEMLRTYETSIEVQLIVDPQ